MTGYPTRFSAAYRFRFSGEDDGSSLPEVALSITVLLFVVMGIIGMSRLAYAKHFVTFAARQGVRYAIVRGSTYGTSACTTTAVYNCQASATAVGNYVKSQVPLGLSVQNVTVKTNWPGTAGSGLSCLALGGSNSPGCIVQVTVSYAFVFGIPFLPGGTTVLQSSSVATILQ